MATGSLATSSATVAVCGTTSEYTCASRTRRAISWAYCAPKSTTSTGLGVVMPRSLLSDPRLDRHAVLSVVVERPVPVQALGEPATGVVHHPDVHHLGRRHRDRQWRAGAVRRDDREPGWQYRQADVVGVPAGDRAARLGPGYAGPLHHEHHPEQGRLAA